jgi:hypothetical protein
MPLTPFERLSPNERTALVPPRDEASSSTAGCVKTTKKVCAISAVIFCMLGILTVAFLLVSKMPACSEEAEAAGNCTRYRP